MSGKELDTPTIEKKNVDEIQMNGEKEEDKQKEEIPKKEPLVANSDALEQIPNYAKFMKEEMFMKRKLEDYEIVKLTGECSSIIKRKLPENFKDPGSFIIACVIGDLHIEKALCDLGTSINLMPLSIFQKLNLGEVTPTTISLQLVDRSLMYPRATRKALIDVHDDNLTLRVNGEELKFNISNDMKFPKEQAYCKKVDVVTPCLRDFFKTIFHNDPLELCLTTPISKKDLRVDLGMNNVEEVDSVFALAALLVENEQLPTHLRYAFLEDGSTKPIIILASLNEEDERKLLETLKRYSSAFALSISDIKGISPAIFMDKILMEDSYKPSIEHQ
ncbi:uncharacterized protein LOC133785298 [Humulus lupulus]|uniref:uncharacterized protein LOC133785298 n=1 Tax=Humulus lupulus TaxID=3486 RepID=UPI002B40835B|nr:uncharacterized protein LOC133785298 [Humulus lupulus]